MWWCFCLLTEGWCLKSMQWMHWWSLAVVVWCCVCLSVVGEIECNVVVVVVTGVVVVVVVVRGTAGSWWEGRV